MPDTTLDHTLYACSALNSLTMSAGQTHIREENPLSIVSLAIPNGGYAELDERLRQHFGSGLPGPGIANRMANDSGDSMVLLGLQIDQCFLVSNTVWPDPVAELTTHLGACAYLTDQSDSWATVIIEGPRCRLALERISPLDHSAEAFPTTSVARTVMEHISVIIEHPAHEQFRLYTPRSSAQSFAHALCTSLRNVSE